MLYHDCLQAACTDRCVEFALFYFILLKCIFGHLINVQNISCSHNWYILIYKLIKGMHTLSSLKHISQSSIFNYIMQSFSKAFYVIAIIGNR